MVDPHGLKQGSKRKPRWTYLEDAATWMDPMKPSLLLIVAGLLTLASSLQALSTLPL